MLFIKLKYMLFLLSKSMILSFNDISSSPCVCKGTASYCASLTILFLFLDDGVMPDRIAQVMGPPDRCQHAAHMINELIHTAQVRKQRPKL